MKTYCISDIHGHLENFIKFKESLNSDDKVFVLGDVIDKGENSIEILQYIMDDDRFTMILGNHEYMMWRYLIAEPASFEKEETASLWMDLNDGFNTFYQFEQLSREERNNIITFLASLSVSIPEVIVGERKYYLAHANPYVKNDLDITGDVSEVENAVWERIELKGEKPFEDKQVIIGHTCVQEYFDECRPAYFTEDIKDAPIIDIDGGLAYPFSNKKLIALCLDDLSYKLY